MFQLGCSWRGVGGVINSHVVTQKAASALLPGVFSDVNEDDAV